MIRRSVFDRVGLFSERLRLHNDMDMWTRAMLVGDIGFVDDELSVFRTGAPSLTRQLTAGAVDDLWLDHLWMLEGLAAQERRVAGDGLLEPLIRAERRRCARQLGSVARRRPATLGPRLTELAAYLRWRLGGRRRALHPALRAAT
jgi:hypothetical protein